MAALPDVIGQTIGGFVADRISSALSDKATVDYLQREGGMSRAEARSLLHDAQLGGIDQAGAGANLPVGQFAITPTFGAAGYHDPEFLHLALAYRGDPNARTTDEDSALSKAFWLGHTKRQWDNYYALLNAGTDLNRASQPRVGIAAFAATMNHLDKAVELLERGYNFDLDSLAMAIYGNGLASTFPDGSKPGRADPQYKYLSVASRMLKKRGVDTERIKHRLDGKNKQVGAGIVQDYSFEDFGIEEDNKNVSESTAAAKAR